MQKAKMGIFCGVCYLTLSACGSAAQDASGSNHAPKVSRVQVVNLSGGSQGVGAAYLATYDYSDADNDTEGETLFQWRRNGEAIAEATEVSYTTGLLDAGTELSVEITPVALTGKKTGKPVLSAASKLAAVSGAFSVSAQGDKKLYFSWGPAPAGKSFYRLSHNPDGASGYTPIVENTSATSFVRDIGVHLQDWQNGRYLLEACDQTGCKGWGEISALDVMLQSLVYVKAGDPGQNDQFGRRVIISADGRTMAVSAPYEDSAAKGINGNGISDCGATSPANCSVDSGAVYVFVRDEHGQWLQQAYLKADNTDVSDNFGINFAISANGDVLAVGAWLEDSAGKGVRLSGLVDDCGATTPVNCASGSGAVYIFARNQEGVWSQTAYIKASNAEANDYFGAKLALSHDGNTLAVGAHGESSSTIPVNGNQTDNSASGSGAAYVFINGESGWEQQAYIKASNVESGDSFGFRVALSADGSLLAVGAYLEDSGATGINGNGLETCSGTIVNCQSNSGAVYTYTRNGSSWNYQAYIKASNSGQNDYFGYGISLAADGRTLAVGAYGEGSSAIGIDGDQADNTMSFSGAVYVYRFDGAWQQQAYIKAQNTAAGDYFGGSVALAGDGMTLAVGAYGQDGNSAGIDGVDTETLSNSGAVFIYRFVNGQWQTTSYVKASNPDGNDNFGVDVSLSEDGNILCVGAYGESSNSFGINGVQGYNNLGSSGAVYIY